MKCPACWTEKAYLRQTKGWKAAVLKAAMLLPMKCQHCYHSFYAFRLLAIGQRLHPPKLRISSVSVDSAPVDPTISTQRYSRLPHPSDSMAKRRAA